MELKKQHPDQETSRYLAAKKQARKIRSFYLHVALYCLVIPILIYINLRFVPEFHWFWFSMLGWGFGIFVHAMEAFQFNVLFSRSWEKRKFNQFLNEELNQEIKLSSTYNDTIMKPIPNPETQKFERAKKRVESIAGFYRHLLAYVLVNLFLITLTYINLEPGEAFWRFGTFSTAFFWGFGLVAHAAGVFGKNIFLGNDWEEKKIQELMDKEKSNKWE